MSQPTDRIDVLFTWEPPGGRGLERMRACVDGIEIRTTANHDEALRLAAGAQVIAAGAFDAQILAAAPGLKWVHAFTGDVSSLLFPECIATPIPMTCLKGTFDIPAAEHALAMMLAFAHRLDHVLGSCATRSGQESEPDQLHGKAVGIVGLGSIGAAIAQRCKALGMQVLGLSRQKRALRGEVDVFLTPADLPRLLAESDFVVVCLPLTAQTRGLIGAPQLAQMKPSACLIDATGQQAVYDIPALTQALAAGRLAGASLRWAPPEDAPLRKVDRLILSPHRAASRAQYDLAVDRFCINMRRYKSGQPLLGLVDKAAGY